MDALQILTYVLEGCGIVFLALVGWFVLAYVQALRHRGGSFYGLSMGYRDTRDEPEDDAVCPTCGGVLPEG